MDFFDTFPFTKLQGKNRGLDWVLQKLGEYKKEIDKIPEYVREVAESGDIKVNVATDKTLTQPDVAADAQSVGTRLAELRNYVEQNFATSNIVLSTIYPIGAIYTSVNSTSPASLFGGTWEQLKDRFLLGAGDTYAAGNTGGEASSTLTIHQMPQHRHAQTMYVDDLGRSLMFDGSKDTNGWTSNYNHSDGLKISIMSTYVKGTTTEIAQTTAGEGAGQEHNNMPPYMVVYMWKRVA